MKIYNKLVRDKIPEIIKENEGKKANIKILSDGDYLEELNKKLQEELKEYLDSGDIEELADLQEVLFSVIKIKGISINEFEKIRLEKVRKRGSFDKKYFLESVGD